MHVREEILERLKSIILSVLESEKVRVYLFGSWARNEEKSSSDIDVAIEPYSQLPLTKWNDLIDQVEESTIPYKVELVNLNEANKELTINIKKEGVLWKDFGNE